MEICDKVVKVYVARDGKEFDTEAEALNYERSLLDMPRYIVTIKNLQEKTYDVRAQNRQQAINLAYKLDKDGNTDGLVSQSSEMTVDTNLVLGGQT